MMLPPELKADVDAAKKPIEDAGFVFATVLEGEEFTYTQGVLRDRVYLFQRFSDGRFAALLINVHTEGDEVWVSCDQYPSELRPE